MDDLQTRLDRCNRQLSDLESAVIAYSGGVDSTVLLALAMEQLGTQKVLAVTFTGLMHPPRETRRAIQQAQQLGAPLEQIDVSTLHDPHIIDNPPRRCYYCKREMMGRLKKLAGQRGLAAVLTGTNADDAANPDRPGLQAEEELQLVRPLCQAGLSKADIRTIAKRMGLDVWRYPSRPCLATRVPFGRRLEPATLQRIDRVEQALETMGFEMSRCRDFESLAVLEFPAGDLTRAILQRDEILRVARQAGYATATVDLAGYRPGAMNAHRPERD